MSIMLCPSCGKDLLNGSVHLSRCPHCRYLLLDISTPHPVVARVEVPAPHPGQYGGVIELRTDVPVLHKQISDAQDLAMRGLQHASTPPPKAPKMFFDNAKFADAIKQRRGDLGLRQLAKEIGGVSASTLSRLENGKTPDMDTFLAVCTWLDMSPAEFIVGASGEVSEDGEENDAEITIRLYSRSKIWLVGDPHTTITRVKDEKRD